ncbi:lipoyl synthase [Alkaliphilus peptidifermentans]|uniref:Lipoyl synthase n=1 Tax=Alkaliphilus peptidifermentans DSM 18978 TaxID=1120976 RepID=A0A1G5FH83_9FIRM|nr:lipoyl synthase [Alkaliphilus peptidifermentans]SCY38527.1 lipoic acid synthetase [Alkaliphilus peptidifermentans DSM 18978]
MAADRKPHWLRIKLRQGHNLEYVKETLASLDLNTVCVEANCPNKIECFSKKTATFMILGRECTRNCSFCNVSHGVLQQVDVNEPVNVAEATIKLGLKHVVITSVTRDDLPDGGAAHFAEVIKEIKNRDEKIIVEVLIPDFQGSEAALAKVVAERPHIINHNIETVPRLYNEVRPMAGYRQSLELLKNVKKIDNEIITKSGIMLGLGETEAEVEEVMADLRSVGCDLLTIGQYLAPSKAHYPIKEYITPEAFEEYRIKGLDLGFKFVASSPLVRSSYHAAEMYEADNRE